MIPLHDDNPTERFPFVTIIFIAVCVSVFLYQESLPQNPGKAFVFHYGAIPAIVFGHAGFPEETAAAIPASLTLLTSMFGASGGPRFINNSNTVAAEFYIDDVAVQEVGYNAGINHGTITGAVPSSYPRVSSVELVSNGEFETNPNVEWATVACTIASIAGGHSGNCLEVTRTGGTDQYAYQYRTFTQGKWYR